MLRRCCRPICTLPASGRRLLGGRNGGDVRQPQAGIRLVLGDAIRALPRPPEGDRHAPPVGRPAEGGGREARARRPDSRSVRAAICCARSAFTVGVGAVAYTVTAVVETLEQMLEHHRLQNSLEDLSFQQLFSSSQQESPLPLPIEPNKLTDGQKAVLGIIALNVLVSVIWRIPRAEAFMYRWFTNSFASKSLCSPMLLSVFSHYSPIHLALNMYVLYSFAPVSVDRFLGFHHFLAFFTTAGVVSSFTSLAHKWVVRSNVRALGASGAICAILAYTCMKIPEARLSIIFMPFFTFSAEQAIYGLIAFDLLGLLFRFRLFDHAAHLGGSLFGVFYAMYGEDWVRKYFHPFITRACEWYYAQ
ncbi:Peptidase, S54 family [Aphelenchoides fujianensis]|nr:Peptidase, S54 family [Aphelenchoides fujianensis]